MPKDTPSMAKNKMRRCLGAIFDPHPSKTEVDRLWGYFESRCAYCGIMINRKSRTGHLDHLLSSSVGGSNNIHNHVLSCARCNGDETREEPWDLFLQGKCENSQALQAKKKKIIQWMSQVPDSEPSPEVRAQSKSIVKEAIENFERSVEKMRALRRNGF